MLNNTKVPKKKNQQQQMRRRKKVIHLCNKLINLFIKYGCTLCAVLYCALCSFSLIFVFLFIFPRPRFFFSFLYVIFMKLFKSTQLQTKCLKCGRAGATNRLAHKTTHWNVCTNSTHAMLSKNSHVKNIEFLSIIHNV